MLCSWIFIDCLWLCCSTAYDYNSAAHSNCMQKYILKCPPPILSHISMLCLQNMILVYQFHPSNYQSLFPVPVLYLDEWTYLHTFFLTFWSGHHSSFVSLPPLQNSNGNTLGGGTKYTELINIGNFWPNCHLDRPTVALDH